jgi:hypothetical protein
VLGDDVRHRYLHQPRVARAIVHGPTRLLGQRQDLGGQRRQPAAARGQSDRPAVTDEQLVAELFAQRRDRDRHSGFGDAQLGGGRFHRPSSCDEHERLQLRERHGRVAEDLSKLARPSTWFQNRTCADPLPRTHLA